MAVALGCQVDSRIYLSDQENMKALMEKNIALNGLESRVGALVLNWYFSSRFLIKMPSTNDFDRGDPLPEDVLREKPNIILAADCVYFEPAFPLLLATLEDLLALCDEAIIYFCFKKRRRADMQFIKTARKKFFVEEIEDVERETFSREGLFLYTFKRKP